jgi:prepilin-type N-terminal cleavage/methylation domain-containing protein/prepilin-type processing-associated H-X9-DG protein
VVRRQGESAGFTLTELLVVTAVVAVLAAITFPLYRSAMAAAKRTVCTSNFQSIGKAMQMYTTDYDDRVPPVNYQYVSYHKGSADRTWVQTLSPYTGDFRLFTCPADTGRSSSGTPSGWEGYYSASLRSNLGYNYMYFSPLVQDQAGVWASHPIAISQIGNTSRTIAFIDSVWDRKASGEPIGGGSWVTVPPCRYVKMPNGAVADSFNMPQGARSYFGFSPVGWQPSSSQSWLVYGGAWPWHNERFTIGFADGSVHMATLNELISGCQFQDSWRGLIENTTAYLWDLNE